MTPAGAALLLCCSAALLPLAAIAGAGPVGEPATPFGIDSRDVAAYERAVELVEDGDPTAPALLAELLTQPPFAEAPDWTPRPTDRPLLHVAATAGGERLAPIVQRLAERGADVDWGAEERTGTALCAAAQAGATAIVRTLLDAGADPTLGRLLSGPPRAASDDPRRHLVLDPLLLRRVQERFDCPGLPELRLATPKMRAAVRSHVEIEEILDAAGAHEDVAGLRHQLRGIEAVRHEEIELLATLLDAGLDPAAPLLGSPWTFGDAALLQSRAAARFLAERGVRPTPRAMLHLVRHGDPAQLAFLLDACGADPRLPLPLGTTPAYWAQWESRREVERELAERGVEEDLVDLLTHRRITLDAVRAGDLDAVRTLATREILGPPGDFGCQCVHEALSRDHAEILAILLERGADPGYRGLVTTVGDVEPGPVLEFEIARLHGADALSVRARRSPRASPVLLRFVEQAAAGRVD